MTPDERRNERIKFTAIFLNTIAAIVAATGGALPLGAAVLEPEIDVPLRNLGLNTFIWILCAAALHLIARMTLRGLR